MRNPCRFLLLLACVAGGARAADPLTLPAEEFERQFAARFQYPPPSPPPKELADQGAGQAEDASYFAAFPDYDRAYSDAARAEARRKLASLTVEAAALSHEQFVLRVAEIAALADNGHTAIGRNAFIKNTPRLPLRTYWFSDGLYVVRATPALADLLGARIDSIDGVALEDVYQRVRRYVGGADNHRRLMLIPVMESPGLLAAAGVAKETNALTLSGVLANGSRFERRVDAIQRDRAAPVSSQARMIYPAPNDSTEGMTSFIPPDAKVPCRSICAIRRMSSRCRLRPGMVSTLRSASPSTPAKDR
jgi:hypothetical protein